MAALRPRAAVASIGLRPAVRRGARRSSGAAFRYYTCWQLQVLFLIFYSLLCSSEIGSGFSEFVYSQEAMLLLMDMGARRFCVCVRARVIGGFGNGSWGFLSL